MMAAFDRIGKMSQFGMLWRGFTCGQFDKLLNQDYPNSNLPFQIRSDGNVQFRPIPTWSRTIISSASAIGPRSVETLPGLVPQPKTDERKPRLTKPTPK